MMHPIFEQPQVGQMWIVHPNQLHKQQQMKIKSLFWVLKCIKCPLKKNITQHSDMQMTSYKKKCTNKYIMGCCLMDLSGSLGFRRVCSFPVCHGVSLKSLLTRMQTVIWTGTDWPFRSPGRYRLHVWRGTKLTNATALKWKVMVAVLSERMMNEGALKAFHIHNPWTCEGDRGELSQLCTPVFYQSVDEHRLHMKSYEHVHHSV